MAKGRARGPGAVRPDGQIRRSQVVTTYGPGAVVDLLHDAVLISGVEHWRGGSSEAVHEPRLVVDLRRKHGLRSLDHAAPLRTPPVGDDRDASRGNGIDAIEFPEWFVCQNPECRALVRANDGLERKGDRRVHDCTKKGTECVPVRFVSACRNGHIDEFPWVWFVHAGQKGEPCAGPRLRLYEGPAGDFASIVVTCRTCGVSRPLIDARKDEANPACRGRRPWLGHDAESEACSEPQRLLVRTASNAWFSVVESALSIPDEGTPLHDRVREHMNVLQVATAEALPVLRTIPDLARAFEGVSDSDLLRAVTEVRAGKTPEPLPLRHAEYRQLVAAPAETPGEVPERDVEFHARSVAPPASVPGIRRVVLVQKLREVRALRGFTRIEPPPLSGADEKEKARVQPVTRDGTWLPACEVLGEGVFIELDPDQLASWEARAAVLERGRDLAAGYDTFRESGGRGDLPGLRFYLLHSLAHLLITTMSLECGYSASAIRERIYCALPGDEHGEMAGILLSTGSPGTDGTLGGLVDEGRRLEQHLLRALRHARLCSNDPVCAHHLPTDPSERWLEGAACYGCLYVAESSCEAFNRWLDRALVVPVIGADPDAAFFAPPEGM